MRPSEQTVTESRRNPRYFFSGTLHLVGSQGTRMDATDLSLTGVRFRSPRQIGEGLGIELVFLNYNITVAATVRNETAGSGKGWEIGVEFETSQPDLLKIAVSAAS
jgi:hypothetical protein